MRAFTWLLLFALTAVLMTGCRGERDKGKNRDGDRPKSAGRTS